MQHNHRRHTRASARFRRWLYRHIPLWIRRHDFELFVSFLCFGAGVPLLLTQKVEATSLEATLPFSVVMAWSAVLAVAPVLIGIGVYRASKVNALKAIRPLRLEVLGLRLLSYACHMYAVVIIANALLADGPITPVVMFLAALGLTCTSRAWGVLERIEIRLEALGVLDVG